MIVDRCRDVNEFEKFHSKYANEAIHDVSSILSNWDYHFCFYDDNNKELLACAYLHDEDGKIMLSGFAKPKQMNNVIDGIKWVSDFMKKDVLFSRTTKKPAKLVLLRSGFIKIDNDLFVRKAG
ncbi:MAG: hypothetical protein MJ211_10030 [Bacteroidales bacterium]|nr:hypothetical protein [Bacteroidales bacterium]